MCINLSKFYNLKTTSAICLAFFILDRILKYLAVGGKIAYQKNYGIAFSINIPDKLLYCYIVILLIIFVVLILLLLKSLKENNLLLITSYQLLVTGMASNLLDRLKFGFIIDYLNFGFFYNNLADIFICLGVIILVFDFLRKK